MKVTNGDIWEARNTLKQLLDQPWPVKPAYQLARLAKSINEHLPVIDQVRVGLIKQYGTKNEKGDTAIQPGDANWESFVAAYNELMSEEVEVWGNEKIVLPARDDIDLTPAALMTLEPFVEVA